MGSGPPTHEETDHAKAAQETLGPVARWGELKAERRSLVSREEDENGHPNQGGEEPPRAPRMAPLIDKHEVGHQDTEADKSQARPPAVGQGGWQSEYSSRQYKPAA